MNIQNVMRIIVLIASVLVVAISAPLRSYAQNKVVVVPLFGEPAKPTIYTEVATTCDVIDNVQDEWSGIFISELTKQRTGSVIEVTWSPLVEVSNIITFNTRKVEVEILINAQAADIQTGGIFRAIDETPNNGAPFSGTTIHSTHTGVPAGQYALAYQIRTGGPNRNNVVKFCDGGVLMVKEIGG